MSVIQENKTKINIHILSLFDTMLNFVVNLLENERDPRQDQ
jgi:hypothetical protein